MKKKKNTRLLMMAAVCLIIPLFVSNQTIFAGDSGCQSGRAIHQYNVYSEGRPAAIAKQQEKFQAAQIRNGENQTPTAGGLIGGDSETRSTFSYFASIFFLFGGIWLLFSILRERWMKRYAPKSAKIARVWNFALKPSFALSTFAFLFAAVIAGSVLTAPDVTSAQKREQNGISTTNQPVFQSAQQFGGDEGITQIGAPVYEKLANNFTGNYYVRGTFSGTLMLGETTLTATQGLDLFFAKFDANNNLLWARQGSGITDAPSDEISVEGVTALTLGETAGVPAVYVAGSFVKSLTLQGGANPNVTLNDNSAAGYNYETFLAKYDTDGNLLWAKGGNSGSPKNPDNLEIGQNTINKIVLDPQGNPYVAGIISGSNFLGRPISDFTCSDNNPCAIRGKSDVLVSLMDQTNGVPIAVRTFGGTGDDNGLDLAIDNITNPAVPQLYLVGNFDSPTIDIRATGGGPFNNPSNAINSFVLKFDFNTILSGNADGIWVNILHNNAVVGVNQVVTDPINGAPYITGYYKGSLSAPSPFGTFIITNNRTGADDAALAGFVAALDASNGSFTNLAGLGGVGNALTIAPGGNIFVVGSLYDTGTFTSPNGVTRTLNSFGGNDLFTAEINKFNFEINSLKAVAGTGYQGLVAVGDPSTADGATKNSYSPLGIALDASGRVVVSGDFRGTLSLDCLTLTTPGTSRHAYIATLSGEPTSCRIWTKNTTSQGGQWNNPNNWNGGIVPAANDSVYVPYDRTAVFDPVYDPATPMSLSGLSIADNQTLTLQQTLNINSRLDLLGGRIDAGTNNKVSLNAFSETLSINGGRVLGKLEKVFFGIGDSYTFPVGTANGYSPVTLSNINAGKGGTFAVTANEGAYPNTATDLPMNRANRWWNLTNGGLESSDITFQYLSDDIIDGDESAYRAYRIPTGGGTATLVNSTINTAAKTVTALNVSEFSDWTLAQPVAPTAANVSVGGRVTTASGQGISQVRILMTDNNGVLRFATTNAFGYYFFDEVETGQTVVFEARHKRYQFTSRIVTINEAVEDLDFMPQ